MNKESNISTLMVLLLWQINGPLPMHIERGINSPCLGVEVSKGGKLRNRKQSTFYFWLEENN